MDQCHGAGGAAVTDGWTETLGGAARPKRTRIDTPHAGADDSHARRYALAALTKETAELATTPEGERNARLNTAAFALGQLVAAGALNESEVWTALRDAAERCGLPSGEADRTIASGLEAGKADPRVIPEPTHAPKRSRAAKNGSGPNSMDAAPPLDCEVLPEGVEPFGDLANAHRLATLRGHDLRHTSAHGWLSYDGRRWERDATGAAQRAAHATARELCRFAGALLMAAGNDKDALQRAQAYLSWAKRSQDSRRLNAMVQVASALEGIACRADAFDRDPMLFNVLNGTIDLKTGKLRPPDREDLITRVASVAFDPSAAAPRWLAFLERVLPDPDVREFMQRWIGYCLTGSVAEQCFVINWGAGDNGKSTAQGVVLELLGEYATQAAPDLLLSKKGEAHPTEQADLAGRRLAICTEVEQGREFAIATLKQLTGGDRIKARFMRQDFFEFDPTHKLMIACNHKPRVRGADHATWRRFLLCPWTVRIPADEKDKALPDKLRAELSGILNWAIDGCLSWQREGLCVPDAVRVATQKYRDESDQIGRFMAACRDPSASVGPDAWLEASELFKAYERWCQREGETTWKQRTFTLALAERAAELNIERTLHDRTRRAIWTGIALRSEVEK